MSGADAEAIAERLARGEPLGTALQALQPSEQRELLKRCAAVHEFDEALMRVLCSIPPKLHETGLDALIRAGVVEPVPGQDGVYRVPTTERRAYYASWWTEKPNEVIPRDLRSLSQRVLEHLAKRDGDDLEALYHLLIVQPDEGLRRFDEDFRAADAQFDLARCQDLLDIVGERLALLGPVAAVLCNDHRRRLRARAMWTWDWYRSARFMLPRLCADATEQLLEGTTSRVLTLWSAGGMGKTSFLQWLIARRCVPDGDACARIDFDDIDPLVASREPWILLLEVAYQLDQQLTDAPFHELLAQYPGQRERLRRGGSGRSGVEGAADDIQRRFAATLHEVDPRQRVVIELDTLEVALLLGGASRDQADLTPLLSQFASALADAPPLRLVLTARYDLSERVSEFRALFPNVMTLELEPFTDAESKQYLTHYRGITRPQLVDAIVRSAGGIPFKLELIADEAEGRPSLDPSELEHHVDADLAYLMNRIVERLEPDLRQLLRYGVVPRMLERKFVDDVLAPALDADEDDIERRWRKLKLYAGRASWVTLDPVEVDAVRFYGVVLEPMRKLLLSDPAHDELHRRAEEWFEKRAEQDPAGATRWLCEAVYHRFRRAGPEGRRYWEERLRDARAERRFERRRALAAEVLGEDYVDADTPRSWREGQAIVTRELLLRARWELAFAAIQLAHPDTPERRDREWLEASRALADLEHLRTESGSASPSEAEMALLRAGVQLVRGNLERARPDFDRALRGRLAREDRLWLRLAYAGVLSSRGGDDATLHFRTALAIAERSPRPDADLAAVYHRLALHHAEHDHIDRGLGACEAGAAHAEGRQAVELGLVRARLELRRGGPSTALEVLPDVAKEEVDIQGQVAIVRTRALLAASHPADALAHAERTGTRLGGTLQLGRARQQAVAAEGRELRGKVRATLLDVDGAIDDFEEAAARWSRLGAADGVCRCWVRGAELNLRGIGNLHEASVRLDQARRTGARRGEDAWTRCTLMGAAFLARTGQPDRATRLVDDAIRELRKSNRPPRALIAAGVQGLAITHGSDQDRYLSLICEQLLQVTPPAARLRTLDGLEACTFLSRESSLVARLRRLVPSPARLPAAYAHLQRRDRALLSLLDAELDRIVGDRSRAQATLAHAWDALTPDPSRAAVHKLVSAAARARATALLEALARRELAVIRPTESAAPVLDGAALVQAAGAVDDATLRRKLLERADALLDGQGAAAGAWSAALLERRADEARLTGDEVRELDLRSRAAEIYEGLGDDMACDRALGKESSAPAARPEPVAEHEIRLTVRIRDGELRVEARGHDGRTAVMRGQDERPLTRELVAAAATGRPIAPSIVERLLGSAPTELGQELAELLRDALATHEIDTPRR